MNQIDRIKSLVGQAVGEASMCWKPDGVFNDGQATKIVEKVVLEIVEELDTARIIGEGAGIVKAVAVMRAGSHKICVMIDSDECVYCGK